MSTSPAILRKIAFCQANQEDFINLNSLDLTELPPEVFDLVHLKTLNAHYNRITTIPVDIKRLTKLETLGLEGNCIENIVPEVVIALSKIPNVAISAQNLEQGQDDWKKQVQENIENADLDAAFKTLNIHKPDDNDLAILRFRYRDNERSYFVVKVITEEEYARTRNQIVGALLSFLMNND